MKVENMMNKKEVFNPINEASKNIIQNSLSEINQIMKDSVELERGEDKGILINNIQLDMLSKLNKEFAVVMDKGTEFKLFKNILQLSGNVDPLSDFLKCIPGFGSVVGNMISISKMIGNTELIAMAYLKVLEHYFNVKTGKVELPENTEEILTYFTTVVNYKKT